MPPEVPRTGSNFSDVDLEPHAFGLGSTSATSPSKHVSFAENSEPKPNNNRAGFPDDTDQSHESPGAFDDVSSLAEFWKEHDLWKAGVLKDKMFENVKVSNPESAPRSLVSLNPTVYYKVTVSDMDGFVRRRYSDFEWLQDLLQSRFVGMVIPPLPPKIVGSGQREFNGQEFLCGFVLT